MKKYVLIMLVILALSFSTMVSAVDLDGSIYSLENILTQDIAEIQIIYTQDFGGVAVLSVCLSEQVQGDYFYNGTIMYFYNGTIMADTGLEVEIIAEPIDIKVFTRLTMIDESRGGTALYAGHYKQVIFS